MASIRGLVLSLRAETAQFHKGLTKARKSTKSFGRELGEATRKASASFAVLATGATTALAAISLKSIEAATEAQRFADALGTSTKDLTGWQYAAESVGVSGEKMADIFKDVSDKIGDFATTGGGGAADLFNKLNLDVNEFVGLAPDKQLLKIGKALDQVGTRSEKTFFLEAIASDATQLLPLLENNAEGLKRLKQEAEVLGTAINDVDAAKMRNASDAMRRAGGVLKGIGNRIAARVAPIIEGIANAFTDAALSSDGFSKAIDNGFRFAVKAVGFFADMVRGLKVVFIGLKAGLISLTAAGVGMFASWLESGRQLLNLVLTPVRQTFGWIAEGVAAVAGAASSLGIISSDAAAKAAEMAERFKSATADALHFDKADSVNQMAEILGQMGADARAELQAAAMEPLPSEVIETTVANWQAVGQAAGEASAAARQQAEQQAAQTAATTQGFNAQLLKQAQYEQELAQNNEFFDSLWLPNLEAQQQVEADLKRIHLGNVTDAEKQFLQMQVKNVQDAERRKQATIADGWGKLVALQGSGSKKMFKIGKAAGIADALISTYKGVAKAMELPWPLNLAVAASNLAFGMMQVQKIRATKFGGGGGGGGGSASPSSSSVSASIPKDISAVPAANDAVADGATAPETRVQVVINGNVSGNDARRLVDEMVDIINQDDVVLISPTSRNGQELAAAGAAGA